MFWTVYWIFSYCLAGIIVLDFILFIEKHIFLRPVRQLFKQKTIDILFLFYAIPQLFVAGLFGRIWISFFIAWAIYRLAKDDYHDDDDDTHGKRLLSWGKSKIPKPYVKPIPVPI